MFSSKWMFDIHTCSSAKVFLLGVSVPWSTHFFSSVRQKWRNTTSPLSHRQRRQRRGQHTDTGREEPSSSRVLTRTRIIAKERPQLYGVSFLQIQTLFRWGYPLFSMTYRSLQGWHDKGGSHRRQQRSDLVQRRKRTRTQKGHTVLVMA